MKRFSAEFTGTISAVTGSGRFCVVDFDEAVNGQILGCVSLDTKGRRALISAFPEKSLQEGARVKGSGWPGPSAMDIRYIELVP